MAAFVVNFGWRPVDYWAMTLAERDAITAVWNESQKKKH